MRKSCIVKVIRSEPPHNLWLAGSTAFPFLPAGSRSSRRVHVPPGGFPVGTRPGEGPASWGFIRSFVGHKIGFCIEPPAAEEHSELPETRRRQISNQGNKRSVSTDGRESHERIHRPTIPQTHNPTIPQTLRVLDRQTDTLTDRQTDTLTH